MSSYSLFVVFSLFVLYQLPACEPAFNDLGDREAPYIDSLHASPDRAGFEDAITSDSSLLEGLRPADPARYLEWRKAFLIGDQEHGAVAATGEPCKEGSPSCEKVLDSLVVGRSTIQHPSGGAYAQYYLVGTRADTAFAVTSPDEAVQFLAPIDTPAEAQLLLRFEGREPDYMRGEPSGTFTALVDGRISDCPIAHQVRVIRVFRDGRTEVIARGKHREDGRACI